jgi:peroxiredoxin
MFDRSRWNLWRIAGLFVIALLVTLLWAQRGRFAPLEIGARVPSYSATTLSGAERSLADYQGKVVLLNVWATWCRPCVQEMPALERLYQQFKGDGLEVVAVSIDAGLGVLDPFGRQGGDVAAFVRDHGLTFTILLDPKNRIEPLFQLTGIPTTVVIDRKGRIVRKAIGIEAWDDEKHQAEVRALLGKDS